MRRGQDFTLDSRRVAVMGVDLTPSCLYKIEFSVSGGYCGITLKNDRDSVSALQFSQLLPLSILKIGGNLYGKGPIHLSHIFLRDPHPNTTHEGYGSRLHRHDPPSSPAVVAYLIAACLNRWSYSLP